MEASATDGTLMEIYKTDMEHFGFDGMRVKQEIFIVRHCILPMVPMVCFKAP